MCLRVCVRVDGFHGGGGSEDTNEIKRGSCQDKQHKQ